MTRLSITKSTLWNILALLYKKANCPLNLGITRAYYNKILQCTVLQLYIFYAYIYDIHNKLMN